MSKWATSSWTSGYTYWKPANWTPNQSGKLYPTTAAPTTPTPTTPTPTTAAPTTQAPAPPTTSAPATPAPTSVPEDGSAEDVRRQIKESGEATSDLSSTTDEKAQAAAEALSPKLKLIQNIKEGTTVKKKDIVNTSGITKKETKLIIQAWYKMPAQSGWSDAKKKRVQRNILKAKFGGKKSAMDKATVTINSVTTGSGGRRLFQTGEDTIDYTIDVTTTTVDDLAIVLEGAENDDASFSTALGDELVADSEFTDVSAGSLTSQATAIEIEIINEIVQSEACDWLL
jgi:hypothetical protein